MKVDSRQETPFQGFKMTKGAIERIALAKEDLQNLMDTGCPFERLNQLKEKQYQVQQGVKRMNKKKE